MNTKATLAEDARIAAFRHRMTRPTEIVIEDAVAYWVEDRAGHVIGAESERTVQPFALVLEAIEGGIDPCGLVVYARLADGTRYEVGSGELLAGMARRSAGVPS